MSIMSQLSQASVRPGRKDTFDAAQNDAEQLVVDKLRLKSQYIAKLERILWLTSFFFPLAGASYLHFPGTRIVLVSDSRYQWCCEVLFLQGLDSFLFKHMRRLLFSVMLLVCACPAAGHFV